VDAVVSKFGIGQPVRRVEDQRFLTGRGRYVDDIDLPQQAFAVLVMSPHGHARIKRIDTAAAKKADGVLAKHDENYMPREVADALKKQGHWKDDYGTKPNASAPMQGASK